MTEEPPTVGVSSTHPTDMPAAHADLPVWNAENWFYEDFVVGQKIRSLRRTISEGESMAFNALVLDMHPYVADQLFATLDTTSRRVYLGDEVGQIVVSDTVGFIRELPHQLVAAFRATLEETIHADLLLHVVDASSAVRLEQIEQVNGVLHEIGADTIRQVLVFNKIDAVPELAARGDAVERDEYGNISRVFLSARTGQGLDALRAAIAEIASAEHLSGATLPDGALDGAPAEPHEDHTISEQGR